MSIVKFYGVDSYLDKTVDKEIINFLKKCNRVVHSKAILLKPNLLSASIPEKGITTNPVLLQKIIFALRKVSNAKLYLGDSPGANFMNYKEVLRITGVGEICEKNSVEIVRIEKFAPIMNDGVIYSSIVNDFDTIINIPKLKTHSFTGLTLGVKNLFGLIPGTHKISYHRKYPDPLDFAFAIYKFYEIISDKVVNILDGIIAHHGEGPARGKPVKLGILGMSDDAVGMDIELTKLLKLRPFFCKTNQAALMKGYDTKNINLETYNITDIPAIKLPMSTKIDFIPKFIKKWIAGKVYVKPEVNDIKCIKCMLCLKSCPVGAIYKDNNYIKIDKKKCIECFCCYEVCESEAIDLKKSLLYKVI